MYRDAQHIVDGRGNPICVSFVYVCNWTYICHNPNYWVAFPAAKKKTYIIFALQVSLFAFLPRQFGGVISTFFLIFVSFFSCIFLFFLFCSLSLFLFFFFSCKEETAWKW